MQTIYLDISNKGVIPVVYAKQGDVGRKVEVVLTNSGLPYEPEAGSAFSAWFSGASGVGNYTDIGGKSAFSVSGNKVMVELITQMLQNAGEGFLCLLLSRANGEQIGLWNIRYICEGIPGAGSEPAKDYYTAFSQAVAGLAYPDASLSVYGKAADAAAVGTALAGKAPAGYGLGEANGKVVSTPNDAINNGFYNVKNDGYNGDGTTVDWRLGWTSLLVERRGDAIAQTAKYGDVIWYRTSPDGGATWQPWEWVNPPMALGVEYRTTERYNGGTKYKRLFGFGQLPNTGVKGIATGISYKDIVSVEVYATESNDKIMHAFPLVFNGAVSADAYVNTVGELVIKTFYDMTKWYATFTITYVK